MRALNIVHEHANSCTDCDFHRNRRQVVFADGEPTAEIVLVGEAPGRNEDIDGIPFTGPAGRLMRDKILPAPGVEIPEEMVYLTNVSKCWPGPGNPTPSIAHQEACKKYLFHQIDIIQPLLIIAAGNPACRTLLKKTGITKLQGKEYKFKNIPVIPVMHPAALLDGRGYGRNAEEIAWDVKNKKRKAYTAWKIIAKRWRQLRSEAI